MNFEDLQKTWQAQPVGATVTMDRDALLREVRRQQRKFQSTIFWRDVREVGACAVLTVFFGWKGWVQWNWTMGVMALLCFGVGVYMFMDHWVQRRYRAAADAPLKDCLASSLHEINHQIWLLKDTIIWTYLLPIDVGVLIVALPRDMHAWHSVNDVLWGAGFDVGFTALISVGVYWLNQYAVRKSLIPRRQELEALLASLE